MYINQGVIKPIWHCWHITKLWWLFVYGGGGGGGGGAHHSDRFWIVNNVLKPCLFPVFRLCNRNLGVYPASHTPVFFKAMHVIHVPYGIGAITPPIVHENINKSDENSILSFLLIEIEMNVLFYLFVAIAVLLLFQSGSRCWPGPRPSVDIWVVLVPRNGGGGRNSDSNCLPGRCMTPHTGLEGEQIAFDSLLSNWTNSDLEMFSK